MCCATRCNAVQHVRLRVRARDKQDSPRRPELMTARARAAPKTPTANTFEQTTNSKTQTAKHKQESTCEHTRPNARHRTEPHDTQRTPNARLDRADPARLGSEPAQRHARKRTRPHTVARGQRSRRERFAFALHFACERHSSASCCAGPAGVISPNCAIAGLPHPTDQPCREELQADQG
jgi:hypothetical protein